MDVMAEQAHDFVCRGLKWIWQAASVLPGVS